MKRKHVFAGRCIRLILILTLLGLAISESAMAGSKGQIAFQFVGKNVMTSVTGPGAGEAFTVGFYTYIAGIPQPLFSDPGAVGAETAYFTFRSEPYAFSTISNDNTAVRMTEPGFLVHIYFNEVPNQSFDNADTFSDGQLIATFIVRSSLATRVENGATEQGDLELVSSNQFEFYGKPYQIRNIVPRGVTTLSSGAAVPIDISQPVFAFSGSALAY
jgi:hypothetical protein